MIKKKNILGVEITNSPRKEILEYIVNNLENFTKKRYIVTPNPEFLVLADKNKEFKNVLNRADLALADGVGVMMAAKILRKPLVSRFAGVDLIESLCKAVAEKPITVGFLGGRDGVAGLTAECLLKKYPGLKVAFAGEEWVLGSTRPLNDSLGPDGNTSLINENKSLSPAVSSCKTDFDSLVKSSFRGESRPNLNNLKTKKICKTIDILFVAFGAPKQEFWIYENLENIPVKIAMGVGGAFDYLSGKIPRAPAFLRNIGLEWLYRLMVQPWRFRRQLSLWKFIWLVVKEKRKNF
jgi:N-acetylglucosaminyldiphosphoundecaprenol N-acetyl-beta-D-mannosaminyltransferase